MKRPWLIFFALLAAATVVLLATGTKGSNKKVARRPAEAPRRIVVTEDDLRGERFDSGHRPSFARTTANEIPALIEGLYDPNDEASYRRLELAGKDAVPALVKALDDPRTYSTRFDDEGRPWHAPKSPLGAICELLQRNPPAAAAKPLAKFIDHDNPEIRKAAALLLGKIGTKECAEPVRKALADEDEYVRSYAMIGIQHGLDDGRRMQLTEDVFDSIAALLDRDDDAAPLLLRIDAERAVPVMLSDRYFAVENDDVYSVLEALNEAGRTVPRERLLPLLEAERPLVEEYRHARAFAEALKAYALNPDEAAEATIRAELDSPHEYVRIGAAEALAILGGVTDAWEYVVDIVERDGFEGLSIPQKRYFAVMIYDGEVNNGGHTQFFYNSSGELWEDALAGLEAMGSTERAAILREAAQVQGVFQQPRFRGDFIPMESLEPLDERYYAVKDDVPALLAAYALEHREHFGGEKE